MSKGIKTIFMQLHVVFIQTKGIGRGIITKLAECGAECVALSKTQENLESLKNEVPGIQTIMVDLADWTATRQALENVGQIDLLVNNAGILIISPFLETAKDDLDKVLEVNFKAVFNVSQIVSRGMVERGNGGAIVNVSSVASRTAFRNMASYCSSKGAMDSLTQVMATELGPHKTWGIGPPPLLGQENIIFPGFHSTDSQDCLTCEGLVNRRVELLRHNVRDDDDNPTFDLQVLRQIRKDTNLLMHRVPHYILPPFIPYYGMEGLLERYRGLMMSVVMFLRLYGRPEEYIHQTLSFDLQEIIRKPIAPDTVSIRKSRLMLLLPVIPEIPN